MITFENGALTTDATLSITDSQAIFQFADYCMQQERERIIKLLENRPNFCSSDDDFCFEWLETGDCDCKELIALIKGEK